MRKLIVLAVALAMAATAAPAFASVQNVKIGGWTNNTFVHRQEFDLGKGSGGTDTQDVFINQTGLQVDADLTDQVYVTIALIGERGWGADGGESESTSEVDIYLAYVTLKEMLYSPLTLVVGRQVFSFGNGLVFDATGANNVAPGDSGIRSIAQDLTKQTSLDAIRAIFDYNPLTVTVFYAKIDQNTVTINHLDDDKDLWGVNANYQLGDDMDSVLEAYFFKQRDKSGNVSATGAKTNWIKVTGVRASTNPIEGLNLQAEVAHQGGTHRVGGPGDNRKRDAWAVQGIVNYQLPVLEEYKPVAQYIFTKTTGDTDTDVNNTDYTGWDPFYEAQGGGHIYNTLFDLTNSVIHSFYFTAEPMEDVTARLALTAIWLERDLKSPDIETRLPTGGTQELLAKTDSSFLGKEINFDLTYDYTEDVTIGTSIGWFFAGSVFDNENNSTAKQALVSMNVAF
ncbi:MAG: alginate export family protein [Candidatus Omnitrophota bacterium]